MCYFKVSALSLRQRQHHCIVQLPLSHVTLNGDVLARPQLRWVNAGDCTRPPFGSADSALSLKFVDFEEASLVQFGRNRQGSRVEIGSEDFGNPSQCESDSFACRRAQSIPVA